MVSSDNLYYILTYKSKGALSLIPDDLDFFADHFNGQPMSGNDLPPKYEVLSKSKPIRDFVSWDLSAPILSQRAVDCLSDCLNDYGQVLKYDVINNTQLYAFNVTHLVDCLDYEKSDVLFASDEPDRILDISSSVIDSIRADGCMMFKLPQYPLQVYVHSDFVKMVQDSKLTGADFVLPDDSSWWCS